MKSNIGWLVTKRGFTQAQVAEMMKVSPQTFNLWAKGKAYPRVDRAVELAKILNCNVDDLYEDK